MPRSPRENKIIKDERKQQIKSIAFSYFSINGFSDANIDAIIYKKKISHGLFYHYFTNLKALIIELNSDANHTIFDNFVVPTSLEESFVSITGLLLNALKNKQFDKVAFIIRLFLFEDIKTLYKNKKECNLCLSIVEKYFNEQQKKGESNFKNSTMSFQTYLSLFLGFAQLKIASCDKEAILNTFRKLS